MSDKGPKELDPRWMDQVTDEMQDDDPRQGGRRQGDLPGAAQVSPRTPVSPTRSPAPPPTWQGVTVHNCDLGCF